ncbi:MAG: AAA family ATPase [Anaerolineae bacterium]|nr:AAA family ATPase [Anaerolineae bacterium]
MAEGLTHNLPPQVTPFVGRAEEMDEITNLLTDPACRLLTLIGPGGIGKTRLALEAAAGQIRAYPDGVYFVPLQAVSSPEYIISTIAEAVRLQIYQAGDPRQQLLNYLGEKKLLLLLDNFEHLVEGVEIVSDILARAPGVKIIATSREALHLQEEWLWPVQGMRFPEIDRAQSGGHLRIEDYSAVQLFVERARRMRADFSFEDEQDGVFQVCALVEGMPLGIELASAWVRVLSCDEIAQEIKRSLDILETRARNVPLRHRSMRAVLEQSWQLLTETEQGVFKRLSVFQGCFTREAAQAVAGAPLPMLSVLVDKSLLRSDAAGGYDMHELVRQYAEEKLDERPDLRDRTHDLHCTYYIDFLQAQWEPMRGSRPGEALDAIEGEIENIRAAWHWAIAHTKEAEIERGLDSLWFFYDTRSRYREGAKIFAKTAEALGADKPTGEKSLLLGKVQARQGVLDNSLSLLGEAKALLQEGLAVARRFGARDEIAFILARLGEIAGFEWKYAEAIQYFNESFAIYEEIGDKWGMAFVLNWLGNLSQDGVERKRTFERCLALFQEIDSQWGIAMAIPCKAYAMFESKEYEKVEKLAREGLTLCEKIGIRWGIVTALDALSTACYELGRYDEALCLRKRGLILSQEAQLVRYLVYGLVGIRFVLYAMGWKRKALEALALCYYYVVRTGGHMDFIHIEPEISPEEFAEARKLSQTFADPDAALKALLDGLDAAAAEDAAPLQPLADPLTKREQEILQLVAAGRSNREIAKELILALGTVKWYINQIYSKLQVGSRTEAVAQARTLGLLD